MKARYQFGRRVYPQNWDKPAVRPKYVKSVPKVLLVEYVSEDFSFGVQAIWETVDGMWICTVAANEISWMKGMDRANAKFELARRGCSWKWL